MSDSDSAVLAPEEDRDINDFVGMEMQGSIVKSAEETKTDEAGGYIKIRRRFEFEGGGYYWKEFYRSKLTEARLRREREEHEQRIMERIQEEALERMREQEEKEKQRQREKEEKIAKDLQEKEEFRNAAINHHIKEKAAEDEGEQSEEQQEETESSYLDDESIEEGNNEDELPKDKLAGIAKMLSKNDSTLSLGLDLMEEAEDSIRAGEEGNVFDMDDDGEPSVDISVDLSIASIDETDTKDNAVPKVSSEKDTDVPDLSQEEAQNEDVEKEAATEAGSEEEMEDGPKDNIDEAIAVPKISANGVDDEKSPRLKRKKSKSKLRKSGSKAASEKSPELSKRRKSKLMRDEEDILKSPKAKGKSSKRKKKKGTESDEEGNVEKKPESIRKPESMRKMKKAAADDSDEDGGGERKPGSMRKKKKKKKDRKSVSKKRDSKRDVNLSDEETDTTTTLRDSKLLGLSDHSNFKQEKEDSTQSISTSDPEESCIDTQNSKPIFMKIMGVWASRKKNTKYSMPLETIGEGKKNESSVKKPPSLKALMNRLKAKTSADDPFPKETPPAKLQNAQAEEIDFEKPYKRPVFEKTKEESKLIKTTVEDNVAFKGLEPDQIDPLVEAFEPKKFDEGATISRAGQPERFYSIVQSGQVEFFSEEGKQVGTAGVGDAFGDMALQGSSVQPVSAVAAGVETVLLQIENIHFRHIVRDEVIRSEKEKVKLLKTVPLFKDLDDVDLALLSTAMVPHEFEQGENITKRFREMPFCIIQKGSVVATDKDVGPGQSMGEGALSGNEKPAKMNAIAASDGLAFTIDTESFKKVFGDFERVKRKHEDQKALCNVKSIRDSGLLGSQLQDLVSQMVEKTFAKDEHVFDRDEKTKPVMYLVRSGKVKLTKADGTEETILPGGFFGQEHLAFKTQGSRTLLPEEISPKYSASAVVTTTCGLLSLQDLAAVTGNTSQAVQPQSHIALKDLERHRLLGEGQYGNVWLVTNKKAEEPEPLALKVQKLKTRKNPDRSNAIRKETKLMRALQHQFIVKLLNVYKEEKEMSMLMSLAPGGELFDVIHRQNADGFWISGMNEACAKFYTAVIADTIAFMHKQKFLYRDLKPENVLIDKDGYPTLTDFGFAKKLVSGKTYTFCGTPNFVAPEVILQRGHDGAADNWSLGVLIFEMIDGDNPFWEEGMDNATLYDVICNSPYFPLPEHVTDTAGHLISRLLEKNPSKRLGTFREKDILEHEWFAHVDMEKLRSKKIKAPKVPDPIKL